MTKPSVHSSFVKILFPKIVKLSLLRYSLPYVTLFNVSVKFKLLIIFFSSSVKSGRNDFGLFNCPSSYLLTILSNFVRYPISFLYFHSHLNIDVKAISSLTYIYKNQFRNLDLVPEISFVYSIIQVIRLLRKLYSFHLDSHYNNQDV